MLWVVAYPQFLKFRALILTVTFAGFATYLLYPAFPPWLASLRGDMPHTVRVVREVWLHLGLDNVAAVFGEKSNYAFPVGALPSLHAAWPFMIMLFFWSRAGRWRILLVGYTLAMAFTLVYTADHFVFDILMGWRYAIVVYAGFSWFWRRNTAPRSAVRTDAKRRGDLAVDEPAVEEVVVGREVEQAVAGVVEEDHALLARLLGRERLVDRGADGVTGLGRRDLALGAGELHRGLERLALRVGDRLHAARSARATR